MKTRLFFVTLTLALSACAPVGLPATPTEEPIQTVAKATTERPNATSTASPVTPTLESIPTDTSWSEPWRIWFEGFSCEDRADCSSAPDAPYTYFSVLSDGSSLEQLRINALPILAIPDGLPDASADLALARNLSPDESMLAYVSRPDKLSRSRRLYVANLNNGTANLIYETPNEPDTRWSIGAVCWSSDSQFIRFMLTSKKGILDAPPTIYSIERDSSNLQELFIVSELTGAGGGICSPDGRELVVTLNATNDDQKKGLYRVSLVNGQWERILSPFYVWQSVTAPIEFQP